MSSGDVKVAEAPCGCISWCEENEYYIQNWEEGCTYHGGVRSFDPHGITLDIFNSDVAELQREIKKLKKKRKKQLKAYDGIPPAIIGVDIAVLHGAIARLEKKLNRKLKHCDEIAQLSKGQTSEVAQ